MRRSGHGGACFVAPFVTQLSTAAKRDPRTLYHAALVVLLGRWLDTYLLVAPSLGAAPVLPLAAIGASVSVLAGMRLAWENDRSQRG
jgi:hypothetical protein